MNNPRTFSWSPDEIRALHSGPYSMAPADSNSVEIEVDKDQTALLLVEHEVVGVLFPGRHRVPVRVARYSGEASRPNRSAQDDPELAKMNALPPGSLILFLSTDPGPLLTWGQGITTTLEQGDELVGFDIDGKFQLRIADPVAFYDSFLRHSEDLADRELWPIAAVLIHDRFCQVLKSRASSTHELGEATACPEAWDAGDLGPFLPDLGLEIVHFSIEQASVPKPLESGLLVPQA